jgi:hypothetical protein
MARRRKKAAERASFRIQFLIPEKELALLEAAAEKKEQRGPNEFSRRVAVLAARVIHGEEDAMIALRGLLLT